MQSFTQFMTEATYGFGHPKHFNDTLKITYDDGNVVNLKVGTRLVSDINTYNFNPEFDIEMNNRLKTSTHVAAMPLTDEKNKQTYYALSFHTSEKEASSYISGYNNGNLKKKITASSTRLRGTVLNVGWGATTPAYKPSLFLGDDEEFASLEDYRQKLIAGINNANPAICPENVKEVLRRMVNNPSQSPGKVPAEFVDVISKDFGEALGPIKILTDPEFMPWINPIGAKIWVPKKSNYKLLDFAIIDQEGVMYKISSKRAGTIGNTVNTGDILDIMKSSAAKGSSTRNILNKLIRKYSNMKLLIRMLDIIRVNSAASGGAFAAALVDADMKRAVSEVGATLKTMSKGDLKNQLPKGTHAERMYKTYRGMVAAGEKIVKNATVPGTELNKMMKLLVNLIFADSIYYAKFNVSANGKVVWEKRAKKTDYSMMNSGSPYVKMYLDGKGDPGKQRMGMRIESLEKWHKA